MCDLSMFCFSNEAARLIRRSVPTLHYYERTHRIQAKRIGAVRVFDRRDLVRLAQELPDRKDVADVEVPV